MGMGQTRVGGGSCFVEVASFWPKQKSSLPNLLCLGSLPPPRCEYLTDGTKVLFHGPLLYGYPDGFQKAGANTIGVYLGGKYGIPDALEVGWDFQPFANLAPLAPGGGVFLEDYV